MPALLMIITDAGLDALVDAENGVTDPIEIVELGLSDTPFVVAPTLTALPGQHRLIDTISGLSVADNVIHVTAYDTTAATYDVTGLGLYLADGTLFAAYSAADPILTKAQLAFGLFSFDIGFLNNAATNITFGNAIFVYPPATETIKGIARIATQARVDAVADAGDDFETIVTPKTLRARLAAFMVPITASLDALLAGLAALGAKTVTGAGMVTGGGTIDSNPVLTVTAAVEADAVTGTSLVKALVPSTFGPILRLFAADGEFRFFGFHVKWGSFTATGNAQSSYSFPIAFPVACFRVLIDGGRTQLNDADNYAHVLSGTETAGGFQLFNHHSSHAVNYIAIGN